MRHLILAAALLGLGFGPARAQSQSDPAFANASRFMHREGAAIFAATCAGCHMPDGRGAQGAGAYPALAGNPRLDPPDYLVSVILRGRHGMPGFASMLDDAQVAAVASYVRTNLGNAHAAPVTPELARTNR